MNNAMSGMIGGGSSTNLTPLYSTGYDLTNETQAMDFLSLMLDDSVLAVWGNDHAQMFWYGIVTVISLFAVHNLMWRITLKLRKRAAASNRSKPAAASQVLAKIVAANTSVFRKLSYPQLTPVKGAFWVRAPPFGTIVLVTGYLGFILALEYINNNVAGAQHYAALGLRAGWLAITQVPLLILLAGKNNLIGRVTGVSYERLNILHRWVARGLLLMATLHFGYQNHGWDQYGLRQLEWSTDTCPTTGVAAYVLLCWLNLSTLAPFRSLCYEFFVVQHLITFFGFIIVIMLHLPVTALHTRVYIWIPIGLYLLDRSIRTLRSVWNNFRPGQATLEVMPGGVTRIRVQTRVKRWSPGAHVLVSIPRFGIGQSHPATIASTPTSHDGNLLFILKSQKGFTKSVLKSANSSDTSLLSGSREEGATQQKTHVTFIDGPYGASQGDFACFDTVLLVAGSTGVTFTLPILLNLADRSFKQRQRLPVHRIEFVWIIRSSECVVWISEELQLAFTQLQQVGIDMKIKIFVTRDERLTDLSSALHHEHNSNPSGDSAIGRGNGCSDGEASGNESTAPPSFTNVDITQTLTKEKATSLDFVSIERGRPAFRPLLAALVAQAEGETGVAVCGPLGLSADVRMAVAGLSATCGQGIYLHVEGFGW